MTQQCIKGIARTELVMGTHFLIARNSQQKSIDFLGREGDYIKFLYNKFTEAWERRTFTQEFGLNIKDGNLAAYKGAVFEVQEATNVSVKYKLIRNFSK